MIPQPIKYNFGTIYRPFEGYYKVKYAPINREQKRDFAKEALSVIESLFEIEASFLNWIFGANDEFEYNEVYQHHLDWFEGRVEWLNDRNKYRWIVIDKYYFANEYKPKEKCTQST